MKGRKILMLFVIIVFMVLSTGCGRVDDLYSNVSSEVTKVTTVTITTTTIPKSTTTEVTTTSPISTSSQTTTTSSATISSQITTSPTVTTTTTVTTQPKLTGSEFYYLPKSILDVVEKVKKKYPDMDIGVGLYSLDGSKGYVYHDLLDFNAASTIKAIYAMYVLSECEKRGIDISKTYITYYAKHFSDGSGIIVKNNVYGTRFTVEYLVEVMLSESDNVAYNMLLDRFPLYQFYEFNKKIGGEDDDVQYGKATINQRKNEWLVIYEYIQSNSKYSNKLREFMTGTKYAYIAEGMVNSHNYMHKSGWMTRSFVYPCACDCAIIDDSYLIIIMTQDWLYGTPRTDAIHEVARAVEEYYDSKGGNIF